MPPLAIRDHKWISTLGAGLPVNGAAAFTTVRADCLPGRTCSMGTEDKYRGSESGVPRNSTQNSTRRIGHNTIRGLNRCQERVLVCTREIGCSGYSLAFER